MVHSKKPPPRRRARRRLSGRGQDSFPACERRAGAPCRLEARRRRAGARGRAAIRRFGFIGADRRGPLRWIRTERQCAGRDGLPAVVARRTGLAGVCRIARTAPAAADSANALRSEYLQTLNLQTLEDL